MTEIVRQKKLFAFGAKRDAGFSGRISWGVMLSLSDFEYDLPEDLIADTPADPRDSCRLLVLNRRSGRIRHDRFRSLGHYLSPGDCLVLNNTRVFPARLYGSKPTGGKVELLLLSEEEINVWACLVRPGRRLPNGTRVSIDGNGLSAEVLERRENGARLVRFGGTSDIRSELPACGQVPFPPYVRNPRCAPEEYQTVYAKTNGSVAAPTAGLHFTEDLLEALARQGVRRAELTLHVGWGTFRPVRSQNIARHAMEKEWFLLTEEAASLLNETREQGGRIVAVGTTVCRALESLPARPAKAACSWTDLFIHPGFAFRWVDALITNFHLPRSTLLMLVSAFAGREKIVEAYREAMAMRYRFFSFGDAMLIA